MLKIKLSRYGKRGQPFYRIIIAEAKSKRDGKYTDLLGTYDPLSQPSKVTLDQAKYQDWLKKGAQPTDTVRHIYEKLTQKK
jgi:small subunit ribosomal protein S16